MRIALELGDFVEAALVAAAESEDVSVVVFAGEACGCDVVREGGADAGNFVGGDGNADSGAADRDAEIGLF